PIKRPCSPDDISRKLCFEEKIDNQSEKIDNRDSKRKKSIENNHMNENPSPDINQIRLLASRQEQGLLF
uniref:Uncharacterized protein n=2 Tax=Romanomermis culicivorax TaxID=13658 RepID=A0A915K7B6_ROMCU